LFELFNFVLFVWDKSFTERAMDPSLLKGQLETLCLYQDLVIRNTSRMSSILTAVIIFNNTSHHKHKLYSLQLPLKMVHQCNSVLFSKSQNLMIERF